MKKIINTLLIFTVAGIFLMVPLLGCQPGTMAPQGKIAFVSNRGERPGESNLYVMNADGSNQHVLANGIKVTGGLSWSPDGKKLVFSSRKNDNEAAHIYIINADGTNETQITSGPEYDSSPSWSPDGKRILFIKSVKIDINSDIHEIYVINADGTNQIQLTNYKGRCSAPRWSPDGSGIIYSLQPAMSPVLYASESTGIEFIKTGGTNRTTILRNKAQVNFDASYSPDGRKIVFYSRRPGIPPVPWNEGIFVMNTDGSNQIRLTEPVSGDMNPSWSPDGKWIVFTSDRGSNREYRQIYVMRPDGSSQIRLTDTPGLNTGPVWSR